MMKNIFTILTLVCISFNVSANTFIIEAGGNQNVTPYYEPQFLTINVGDTIIWDFVLGTHNVTTTNVPAAPPEIISSGDIASPGEFMFVFTIAGDYHYECTLFSHADTQFGTITVLNPEGVEDIESLSEIEIFPNPTINELQYKIAKTIDVKNIYLVNSAGVRVDGIAWNKSDEIIDVSQLSAGMYIMIMETSEGIIRKSVQIEK